MPKSEERTGLFGGTQTEHDDDVDEVGASHDREGHHGGKYVQYGDHERSEAGQSVERQGLLGGTYIEHTSSSGPSIAVSDAGSAGGSFELSDMFAGGVAGHLFRLRASTICYGSGYVITTVADPFSGRCRSG